MTTADGPPPTRRPLRASRATGLVAMGAAAGALLRWGMVEAFPEPDGWPWAVFVVNVTGSLLLGLLVGRDVALRSQPLLLLLATGFCGSLTTFSGFAVETAARLDDGRVGRAVAYALASLGAGLLAFWAGTRATGATPR